jgi:hypothetical protein
MEKSIPMATCEGLLLHDILLQQMKPKTVIYGESPGEMFEIPGREYGFCQISRAVGSQVCMDDFIEKYSSPASPQSIQIDTPKGSWTLKHALVSSMSSIIHADNMAITGRLNIMFIGANPKRRRSKLLPLPKPPPTYTPTANNLLSDQCPYGNGRINLAAEYSHSTP